MARIIFLDSGPLGMACQELGKPEAIALRNWMWQEYSGGSVIVVPEIADYEVRRSLILERLRASPARRNDASLAGLDELPRYPTTYLPLTTGSIRRAAELWAWARLNNQATSSEGSIDGDVMLAAQTLEYCSDADDWWVATGNAKHLSRYLGDRARHWRNISRGRA